MLLLPALRARLAPLVRKELMGLLLVTLKPTLALLVPMGFGLPLVTRVALLALLVHTPSHLCHKVFAAANSLLAPIALLTSGPHLGRLRALIVKLAGLPPLACCLLNVLRKMLLATLAHSITGVTTQLMVAKHAPSVMRVQQLPLETVIPLV
jgi:hypothetical protein